MKYKFKIGDKVEIITGGSGFNPSERGKIATITKLGTYEIGSNIYQPGYLIKEKYKGNPTMTNSYNEYVGESSFKLYDSYQENQIIDNLLNLIETIENDTSSKI